MKNQFLNILTVLWCLGTFAGCASMARGVTEAVLNQPDKEKDERACQIEGGAFEGMQSILQKNVTQSRDSNKSQNRPSTKVLMIHGIGTHHPGYSSQFAEGLTRGLNLTVTGDHVSS